MPLAPHGSAPDPRTLHLWCVEPSVLRDLGCADECLSILDGEERTRLERFRVAADRERYLVGRVLLRKALSRCADVEPHAWRFVAGANGRPEIAGPLQATALRFNLSHTDGLVACMIGIERDIGVDVEALGRRLPSAGEQERYLSPAELEEVGGLDADAKPRRFLQSWTLKEAYLKARGSGLTLKLAAFGFEIDGGGGIRADLHDIGDDGGSWQFELLEPTGDHVLAVAVRRGSDPDLTISRQVGAEVLLRS